MSDQPKAWLTVAPIQEWKSPTMKTKTFDWVEMKRMGAAMVQEQISGMSLQDELAYWRQGTRILRALRESHPEDERPDSTPGGEAKTRH